MLTEKVRRELRGRSGDARVARYVTRDLAILSIHITQYTIQNRGEIHMSSALMTFHATPPTYMMSREVWLTSTMAGHNGQTRQP
jgi:hypothetical protein